MLYSQLAKVTNEVLPAIALGHIVLLQGVSRIFSVKAFGHEVFVSLKVHMRVIFKTPLFPQLSVQSGFDQFPNVYRSKKMETLKLTFHFSQPLPGHGSLWQDVWPFL